MLRAKLNLRVETAEEIGYKFTSLRLADIYGVIITTLLNLNWSRLTYTSSRRKARPFNWG